MSNKEDTRMNTPPLLPRDPRDPRDSRDPRDPRDSRDSRDSRDQPQACGYAAALLRGSIPSQPLSPEAVSFTPFYTRAPPPPPRPVSNSDSNAEAQRLVQSHTHHHYYHNVQMCANCGSHGHMYRVCSYPVSSFGIICIRSFPDADGLPVAPFAGHDESDETTLKTRRQYLMVQRKDSLAFVEFVRGKYNIQNRGYLLKLLSGMTCDELDRLTTSAFDDLWHGFWQSGHTRTFLKEYEQSKARFTMLRSGYYLRPANGQDMHAGDEFFSLAVAVGLTLSVHSETEFGFPKGRRNINETDLQCALREFSEETGVDASDVDVLNEYGPCEEVFCGSNGVRYRHVYYVAELKPDSRAWDDVGVIPVVDPVQLREVKATGWFEAAGVLERLRMENQERRAMFTQLDAKISSNNSNFCS